MGPAPNIVTTFFGWSDTFSIPLMQHANGSAKAASSNEIFFLNLEIGAFFAIFLLRNIY